MRRSILFACFVLGGASGGAIAVAMQSAPDDTPGRVAVVAASSVPTSRPAPGDTAERLRQWSAASLARPLFAPNRRPFEQAQMTSAPAVLPRLSGIVTTPAGSRAIFAGIGPGKPVVVVEGGSVGSFLVQSISDGEVVLVGPDGPHSLQPSFDPALQAMPPPAQKEATP